MAGHGNVLRDCAGKLALPRGAAPAWLRWASTILFYGYVALLILAGAWGVIFGRLDQSLLLSLDLHRLPPRVHADVMSQYRFLRAIELGFGLFAFLHRNDIFRLPAFNRLFLFTMAAGVVARVIGTVVDGSPSLAMYLFGGLELVGLVAIYAYTRATLRRAPGRIRAGPPTCAR
jgi:Domain of unknown function (DUF4345)